MVANVKCEDCKFLVKCVAYNKLKPFLDSARTDLGVSLTFDACDNYTPIEEDEE